MIIWLTRMIMKEDDEEEVSPIESEEDRLVRDIEIVDVAAAAVERRRRVFNRAISPSRFGAEFKPIQACELVHHSTTFLLGNFSLTTNKKERERKYCIMKEKRQS